MADAAQEVRRQFRRDQLASKSKTQHKTKTEWAVSQVLSRDYFVTSWLADRSKVSAYPLDEILSSEQPVGLATSAPASRQPIMLWAYVVAAHEDTYHRDSHRQADTYRAGYLRHLLDLGYTPAKPTASSWAKLDALVTARYGLAEVAHALDHSSDEGMIKTIIRPAG
ncbi:MAG: hypothetical protein ACR2P2_00660 [Nakamurella sp.]